MVIPVGGKYYSMGKTHAEYNYYSYYKHIYQFHLPFPYYIYMYAISTTMYLLVHKQALSGLQPMLLLTSQLFVRSKFS